MRPLSFFASLLLLASTTFTLTSALPFFDPLAPSTPLAASNTSDISPRGGETCNDGWGSLASTQFSMLVSDGDIDVYYYNFTAGNRSLLHEPLHFDCKRKGFKFFTTPTWLPHFIQGHGGNQCKLTASGYDFDNTWIWYAGVFLNLPTAGNYCKDVKAGSGDYTRRCVMDLNP